MDLKKVSNVQSVVHFRQEMAPQWCCYYNYFFSWLTVLNSHFFSDQTKISALSSRYPSIQVGTIISQELGILFRFWTQIRVVAPAGVSLRKLKILCQQIKHEWIPSEEAQFLLPPTHLVDNWHTKKTLFCLLKRVKIRSHYLIEERFHENFPLNCEFGCKV